MTVYVYDFTFYKGRFIDTLYPNKAALFHSNLLKGHVEIGQRDKYDRESEKDAAIKLFVKEC